MGHHHSSGSPLEGAVVRTMREEQLDRMPPAKAAYERARDRSTNHMIGSTILVCVLLVLTVAAFGFVFLWIPVAGLGWIIGRRMRKHSRHMSTLKTAADEEKGNI